jgi:hypothetical protein
MDTFDLSDGIRGTLDTKKVVLDDQLSSDGNNGIRSFSNKNIQSSKYDTKTSLHLSNNPIA